jgi:hypothetical protein
VTDLDTLWLATLHEVVGRAAHDVKDALNGVHLNLEAIRSRSARLAEVGEAVPGAKVADVSRFAASAADQLESVTSRTEALLFLVRPHRDGGTPADVALTLKHLATLLVPATRSDGGLLTVEGQDRPAATSAPAQATRLALAAAMLILARQSGASRCQLQPADPGESTSGTVVRFSHESADACSIEPALATALAEHHIRTQRSGSDLLMVFPGT